MLRVAIYHRNTTEKVGMSERRRAVQRCAPRYFLAAAVWTPKLVGGGGLTAVW